MCIIAASLSYKTFLPLQSKRIDYKTNNRGSQRMYLSNSLQHNENVVKFDKKGKKFIEDTLQEMLSKFEQNVNNNNNPQYPEDVEAQQPEDLLNSVVRIYCTHSEPNFIMPWQRQKQGSSTSSGFVINIQSDPNDHTNGFKKYILTNAHAVEYGSIIQVKKRQSESKYLAKVLAVGHECDLAILDIEDSTFWNDIKPLTFGPYLPDLQDEVSVIGYPVGGDSISISSGVVSRIEMQEYAQASAQLLAIQIDAAINPVSYSFTFLKFSFFFIFLIFS